MSSSEELDINLKLTEALKEGYRTAGEKAGYWARRYIQALNRSGGFATAKRMLTPRTSGERQGLDALLAANCPDLTLEYIILRKQFRSLFTQSELKTARDRLGDYKRKAKQKQANRERLYPDELEPGRLYYEGAKKSVRVNAYERNSRARKDCLKHHGHKCAVCNFSFERLCGRLGKDFIHVQHLKPLKLSRGTYQLNPKKDLVPICPNCHACCIVSIHHIPSRKFDLSHADNQCYSDLSKVDMNIGGRFR